MPVRIFLNRSMHWPVAFCVEHTEIEPTFLRHFIKIYYAINACMTKGFTFENVDL